MQATTYPGDVFSVTIEKLEALQNKKYDFMAWNISLKHKDLLFDNQDTDIVYCRITPNPFI